MFYVLSEDGWWLAFEAGTFTWSDNFENAYEYPSMEAALNAAGLATSDNVIILQPRQH